MSRLEHAARFASSDSLNNRCKIRRRLASEVHKRSASTERHPWRVSRAFTRWSNNFGLFCDAEVGKVGGMPGIFPKLF